MVCVCMCVCCVWAVMYKCMEDRRQLIGTDSLLLSRGSSTWVKLSHLTRSVCLLTGSLRNQLEDPFIKLKHIKNGRRVITADKKSFL